MQTLIFCLLTSITLSGVKVTELPHESIQIPVEVQESCEKWGEEYEICPELLEAMCWHETRCRPELENGGCVGITQINPKYHQKGMELLGVDDLLDYDQNIHLCAYTIRQYANENDDLYYVLMCWNSGSSRGKKLFDQGKFTKYAIEVSQESCEIERLHGK